jgi:hypothetical protein
MKKLAILLAIVFMATSAWAAPFIACDPQAGVTNYQIAPDTTKGTLTLPAGIPAVTSAIVDGSLKLDLATVPAGTYNLLFKACKVDSIWGTVCSVTQSPFTFTRPIAPIPPSNLKLIP